MAVGTKTITCQSSGTLSVRFDVAGTPNSCLFFVPDCDHYVKHNDKEYAAFLIKDHGKSGLLFEYKDGRIQISVNSSLPVFGFALVTACANNHKVTIDVEIEFTVGVCEAAVDCTKPMEIKRLTAVEYPKK